MVRKVIGPRQVSTVPRFDGIPWSRVFIEAVRIAVRFSGMSRDLICYRLHLRLYLPYSRIRKPGQMKELEARLLLEGLARMVRVHVEEQEDTAA